MAGTDTVLLYLVEAQLVTQVIWQLLLCSKAAGPHGKAWPLYHRTWQSRSQVHM